MRSSLKAALLAGTLVACASESNLAINPAPELMELNRMVGNWSGTSQVVTPSREEFVESFKQRMPDFQGEVPTTFRSAGTTVWILSGTFLKQEGWYEMGPGMRSHFLEYFTWDASTDSYRSWYFNEQGECITGTMSYDAATKNFIAASSSVKHDGTTATSGGTIHFANADQTNWSWFEESSHGRMEFRGTTNREGARVELPSATSGADEMRPLAGLVGDWSGKVEIIAPTGEEYAAMMRAEMPNFEGEPQTSFDGTSTCTWVLDGKFIQKSGTYEFGPGLQADFVELIGWDAQEEKFHSYFFGSFGDFGESWWTPSADSKTFETVSEGVKEGETYKATGTLTIQNDTTVNWTWTEQGPTGLMEMEGKEKRR